VFVVFRSNRIVSTGKLTYWCAPKRRNETFGMRNKADTIRIRGSVEEKLKETEENRTATGPITAVTLLLNDRGRRYNQGRENRNSSIHNVLNRSGYACINSIARRYATMDKSSVINGPTSTLAPKPIISLHACSERYNTNILSVPRSLETCYAPHDVAFFNEKKNENNLKKKKKKIPLKSDTKFIPRCT
jgi:hypothetical protein